MDRAHRPLQLIAPLLQAVLLEQGRQLAHLVRVVRLRLRLKVRVGGEGEGEGEDEGEGER